MSSSQVASQAFQKDILEGAFAEGLVEKLLQSRESLTQKFRQKNLFAGRDDFNYSEHEGHRKVAERFAEGYRILKADKNFEALFRDMTAVLDVAGFFLNTNAFLKTIEMLGDDEQVKELRTLVLEGKATGCYGQTELGHGSNVQGLETQAHYDSNTKTFRMKSPKASSAKYWPGMLGRFGTHAVIQAQTFVGGKSIGIQTFVIEIRNEKLQPFERVEIGDIGSKLGLSKTDNGYLLFHDYVVPKKAMLSRYIKIDEKGNVLGLDNKQNLKYGYGSMLNLRVLLVSAFGMGILRSTWHFIELHTQSRTIKEIGVQKLVINSLCAGYGIILANKRTFQMFRKFTKHLESRQFKEADELLTECHIVSSTCKALASWKCNEFITAHMEFSKISTLRSSGIPQSYVDMHPAVTYEGDNTVLLQLTARQLLKSEQASSPKPGAIVDPRSIDSMMVAAAYVSDREVERIKECIGKALESGKDMESIWNEDLQRELVEVSKIWGYYTMIKHCSVVLKGTSPNYRPLYSKICMVFCGQLIMSIKRLPFYGLKFEPIDVMTVFSEEEKDVLFSIYDPFGLLEPYQLNSEYLDKKGSSMLRVAQQQLQAKL